MKVLYLTPGCFDKGGISRYNRYQVKVLRELYGSDSVRVLSLLGPDEHSFEDDIEVYWKGDPVNGFKPKILFIWKVVWIALFWKPGTIWLGHVNLSGLGWLLGKLSGAYTILNVYGLEVWSSKRKDAEFGLRHVDYIVSDCHNTANYLVDNRIRDTGSVCVVWDCVDVDRFKPQPTTDQKKLDKYGIAEADLKFYLLTLGRLSKPDAFYKGYKQLLQAFGRLQEKYLDLRLVFAGRGNYIEELRKYAADLGVEKKVVFTGSIEENDLVDVYCSCKLFSLITESGEGKGEGIPLTPLEAMSCGKPILVGNQDGSREAIFNGSNGFLLDPGDIDGIVHAIERYLSDPDLLASHSKGARSVALGHFSYERFKNEHIALMAKWRIS